MTEVSGELVRLTSAVSELARVQAIRILKAHPEISADCLGQKMAWLLRQLAGPLT